MSATVPSNSPPGARAGAPRRAWAMVFALALASLAVGACSEQLETTGVCTDASGLCPEQGITVEEVVLQPVVLDTSLAGVPILGSEPYLALVRRGDSIDTRAVVRFDDLPLYHRTSATGTDSALIANVVSPAVRLVIDNRESDFAGPVTIEAFDVLHGGADTSSAETLARFTDEHRIGSLVVSPPAASDTTTFDTLAVPIDPAHLLARIQAEEPLRVGLRVTGSDQASVLVTHGATLFFRAAADTAVPSITLVTTSTTPGDDNALRSDLRSYVVIAAGTAPPPPDVVAVGGLPNRRSLLRFDIPEGEIPTGARIVRATLVLTQKPVAGYAVSDTFAVNVLPVSASRAVTDVDRLMRLASNPRDQVGGEVQLVRPMILVPGDSGQKEIGVANLVSLWSARSGVDVQPAIVLAPLFEGASALRAEFFSSEAAPELRPTLRLSFIRPIDFDLP